MLMQGDVIVVDSGPVCIVSHACSMRRGTSFHITQIVAPIQNHFVHELAEYSAPVLAEAELHEQWVSDLGATAEPDFHQLLDADSRRLRRRLNEAHTRPQVRMAVRREIRRREELL